MINIGDKAPDLLGLNESGKEIRLSDYKGKKVVLYFYPKDMTSGCTRRLAICGTTTVSFRRRDMR